jgi:hypothetical protein
MSLCSPEPGPNILIARAPPLEEKPKNASVFQILWIFHCAKPPDALSKSREVDSGYAVS